MTSTRHARRKVARRRLFLEGLETRQVLSASPGPTTSLIAPSSPLAGAVSVIGTDPPDGSVLTQSPATITVTFNEPIDPFSLGVDFDLDQVAADGSTTPVLSNFGALTEPFVSAPTSTLTMTVNTVLSPGHYRLMLLGFSTLAGANGDPLANGGVDQAVADFTVAQPGVTLAGAADLGTPGPGSAPTVVSGGLDFASNPTAVSLYKVTLPAGHFWRLGAEVSATRDGGTLQSGLSLFDARGHSIAISTTGSPDFPLDPYLFAGLQPGTYYIGVSDAKNLAGQPGGYDPVTGAPGTASQDPVGGPFRLHLVADPADAPTRLLGFTLHWADPLDPRPTGMTLAFSGPLNLDAFRLLGAGQPFQGLVVLDQSGHPWSVTPVGFQAGDSEVTFVFDSHLPAGQYTVAVPSQGGLTDLAGLTPVAQGQPAGVLAHFSVPRSPLIGIPGNLGVLTPDQLGGIVLNDSVRAGGSVTYRFVVEVGGVFDIQSSHTGGPAALQLIGPNGLVRLDPGPAGTAVDHVVNLKAGVYYFQEIATGWQAASFHTTLSEPPTDWEHFWDNGVAQGPALNLTLVSPGLPRFSDTAPSTTVSGPSPLSSGPQSTPGVPASPPSFAGLPAGPAGLILTLGNSLVGRPSSASDHVAAVGPGVDSGTTSLAANATGLLQGIVYGRTQQGYSSAGDGEPNNSDPEDEAVEPTNGALTIPLQPAESRQDDVVLADAEWTTRLGDLLARWVRPAPAPAPLPVPVSEDGPVPAVVAERIVLHRDDEGGPRPERAEQAGLGMPLGLGVATVVALRLRQPFRRWLSPARSGKRPPVRAPHSRV
jgi:hypothetical protein